MNAPNFITICRLASVPVAVWLISIEDFRSAFWLFVAAGISDAADGFIARFFHSRTDLGAILDPIADKALLVCAYLALGVVGGLPMWLPVLVVLRDAVIVGGYVVAQLSSVRIRHEPIGISKVNTVAQIALAALVLARLGLGLDELEIGTAETSRVLTYMVAATTLLSGGAYFLRWGRDFARVQELP